MAVATSFLALESIVGIAGEAERVVDGPRNNTAWINLFNGTTTLFFMPRSLKKRTGLLAALDR